MIAKGRPRISRECGRGVWGPRRTGGGRTGRLVLVATALLGVLTFGSGCDHEGTSPPTVSPTPTPTPTPPASPAWTIMGPGLHDPVTALFASSSELVVATVDRSDSLSEARLWSWSGSDWAELTSRISGEIFCIARYRGVLLVGGSIALGPEGRFRGIAQWTDSAWSPVGAPLGDHGLCDPPHVGSMVLWNNTLAFAGGYHRPGNVATWDGQVVRLLPCDLSATLAVWRGGLLAGGSLDSDVLCDDGGRLLTWQGSQWADFAGGIQVPPGGCPPFVYVSSLLVSSDEVIVAGWFSRIAGVAVQNVARYRNGSWEPMGALGRGAPALLEADGHVLAVGLSSRPRAVGSWDGVQWAALGSDFDGSVRCLAAFGDRMVAGGDFTGRVAWFSVGDLPVQ